MQIAIRLLLDTANQKERASKSEAAKQMGQVERLIQEAARLRAAASILRDHQNEHN